MIAQLGPPTFFMTLTSYELQPTILLSVVFAHMQTEEYQRKRKNRTSQDTAESKDNKMKGDDDSNNKMTSQDIAAKASETVQKLMNKVETFDNYTALELCKKYSALPFSLTPSCATKPVRLHRFDMQTNKA